MIEPEIWVRARSEIVTDCRVFEIRRDTCVRASNDRAADFYVIESPDWVNVIPLTKDGTLVMIEQFRHGTEDVHLELPGGLIDEGEDPKVSASRELLEETGYSSDKLILLGTSRPNPAIQSNTIFHYLALDCERTAETSFDENESIVTRLFREDEVEDLIINGKITHSLVVAAFYYYKIHTERNQAVSDAITL